MYYRLEPTELPEVLAVHFIFLALSSRHLSVTGSLCAKCTGPGCLYKRATGTCIRQADARCVCGHKHKVIRGVPIYDRTVTARFLRRQDTLIPESGVGVRLMLSQSFQN